jgi:hypothetical protein
MLHPTYSAAASFTNGIVEEIPAVCFALVAPWYSGVSMQNLMVMVVSAGPSQEEMAWGSVVYGMYFPVFSEKWAAIECLE